MKNEWLNRKDKRQLDRKTLESIDSVIQTWQATGEGSERLAMILNVMATNVIDYLKPNLPPLKRAECHADMTQVCLAKLVRLDTTKGRAFNYCTTIMLAVLRQLTVKPRDLRKAKEEYREYLASRNSRTGNRREA